MMMMMMMMRFPMIDVFQPNVFCMFSVSRVQMGTGQTVRNLAICNGYPSDL